jgi:hypothetical protein
MFIFSVDYMELLLAIPYIGAIIAPLNYRWVRPFKSILLPLIKSTTPRHTTCNLRNAIRLQLISLHNHKFLNMLP